MIKFKIQYRDKLDNCCPIFTKIIKAYSKEHAIELFFNDPYDMNWTIISIQKNKGVKNE